MTNILDIGDILFASLVVIVATGITTNMIHGYGTKHWKDTFVGLLLLLLVSTQLYYIIQAANFVPTYPYQFDSTLTRKECLQSSKGGKRPVESHKHYDLNPCFCYSDAGCFHKETGVHLVNRTCPTDGTYECRPKLLETKGYSTKSISIYIDSSRNCEGGRRDRCTKDEPCDPCDRNSLVVWGSGRCRTCSSDFKGNCNFVEGEGPYCRVSPDSLLVMPCKKCCTEPEILIVNDTCY